MNDKLKKGQAFIGIDDNKYYYLGLDYNEQIMFTTEDLWTDVEQQYFVKNNLFIKQVLSEKSDIIENSTWYFQSLKELENTTTEEKVKRVIDIINNSNEHDFELMPIKIGPLVRCQAYSSENNQYYELIGFLVENKVFVDKKFNSFEKGFFAIYHSNCDESVPLIFERGFKDSDNSFLGTSFVAGNNDRVDIKSTVIPKEEVNKHIPDDISRILLTNYDDRTK